jgi:hypothetical protein
VTNVGSATVVGMEGSFRGGPDLNAWTAYFTYCPSAGPALDPGSSCTIPITFAPTKAGKHRSRFLLVDNLGDSLTVTVTGTGA